MGSFDSLLSAQADKKATEDQYKQLAQIAAAKSMLGSPVDTRTFQQYDQNVPMARKQLSPIFNELKGQVGGMADVILTPSQAMLGDKLSQDDLKSRIIPDPDKEYMGAIGGIGRSNLHPETLVPAVVRDGKVLSSPLGKTHYDASTWETKVDVPTDYSPAGFITPDGKYLDRVQSMDWLKENRPETFKGLDRVTRSGGRLESTALAHAEGYGGELDSLANDFLKRHFGIQ